MTGVSAQGSPSVAVLPSDERGAIVSVEGSSATARFPTPMIEEGRATVGSLVAIRGGHGTSVIGMVAKILLDSGGGVADPRRRAIATIDLIGEIGSWEAGHARFRRGVRRYPTIGDVVELIGRDEVRLMHTADGARIMTVGHLNQDAELPACVDADQLLSKHFAVVGSTGVGKSSAVAAIVSGLMEVRPEVRVLMLDVHNEYGRIFGPRAAEIDGENLRLPFWLLNFEEITDVVYGGKPAAPEEIEILAELIPAAKAQYLGYQDGGGDRSLAIKKRPNPSGFTADTPTPYQLQDLLSLIDERMGRLENRSSRMAHHRLMMRIEAIRNDPRYAFLFRDALAGGDSMACVLNQLFSLDAAQRPLNVLKLASLPDDVVDAVVCVTARLAFDFALWSDGAMPILLVCEEAHRYVSADDYQSFAPARRALSRIAREGRKYGVHLGLVTQRPAELDPTILSQCSTLFAMRMANEVDQNILRAAVSDAAANMLSFLPSLAAQEAVGVGEGLPLPARFTFRTLPKEMIPRSDSGERAETRCADGDVVKRAIERWRRATTSPAHWGDGALTPRWDSTPAPVPDPAPPAAAVPSILRQPRDDGGYTPLRR